MSLQQEHLDFLRPLQGQDEMHRCEDPGIPGCQAWPGYLPFGPKRRRNMTQHMQINNSLVVLIFVSFEEFVNRSYSLVRFTQRKGIRAGVSFQCFRHSLAQC